jgi:SAM-dependent methyltransferase
MSSPAAQRRSPFYARQLRRLRALRADLPHRLDRRRLLLSLPRDAVCAEVGTWRGDFAERILRSTRPRVLHLVDPWQHREEDTYRHALFGGGAREGQAAMDAVYAGVLERFREPIEGGRVQVHRARSVDAAAAFEPASLDWAYIDGDHTYEAVRADLEAYYRAIRPGGFLAGDDYGEPGWWGDGVTRAVDEFAPRGELRIIGSQFLLRKPA